MLKDLSRKTTGVPLAADEKSRKRLATLVPGFKERVERVIDRMRQLGWDAICHEGVRTPDRARQLAAEGRGIYPSLHMYGLAADITSLSRGWAVPEGFWEDLETAAKAQGLYSGRKWTKPDPAHVQAVPVSEQQAAMRWTKVQRTRKMRARFA